LTYECNSRCQTCNVWQRKNIQELGLKEYEKIFKNIGQSPYEIILTGGEPFLKKEIVQICQLADKYLKPKIIIIPTNGLLFGLIPQKVEEILSELPETKIVVNLSLDGIGSLHDKIRGVQGNFEKVLKTFNSLENIAIKNKNLDLKVHTVISKFNVKEIPRIYRYIKSRFNSSFITEIAEERVELRNIGSGITPLTTDYVKAIDFLLSEIEKEQFSGLDKITQVLRIEYYKLVKKVLLNKKQAIPCLAAIASAQITPDGEVWACCIKSESMGNLREANYSFRDIWQSEKARDIRRMIKQRKCYCPLANTSYTNMLCHFPTLFRVVLKLI